MKAIANYFSVLLMVEWPAPQGGADERKHAIVELNLEDLESRCNDSVIVQSTALIDHV